MSYPCKLCPIAIVMEDDTDLVEGPPVPVHERYFTRFYHIIKGLNGSTEDQCILKHSNRICVVCIAPSHSLLTEKDINILNINFNDLACNSVSGKKKKGGFLLNTRSVLCTVTCEDGRIFKLRSCVKGTLVEINDELVRNPGLLCNAPLSDGYIAILLPKFAEAETVCSHLLNTEEYMLSRNELTSEAIGIK